MAKVNVGKKAGTDQPGFVDQSMEFGFYRE